MRLLFVGGVHGDERSGLRVCEKHGCTFDNPYVEKDYYVEDREGDKHRVTVGFLIAHVEACKRNVHYIDSNLNDCFGDTNELGFEGSLQKRLIAQYGKDSDKFAHVVIDMHSSKENASMLMFSSNETRYQIVKVCSMAGLIPYYCSCDLNGAYCDQYLGKQGVTLEMNCDNGIDDYEVIAQLDRVVHRIIETTYSTFSEDSTAKGLSFVRQIHFPRDMHTGKYLMWPHCCVPFKSMDRIHDDDPLLINPTTRKVIENSDGEYTALFANVLDYYEFGEALVLAKETVFINRQEVVINKQKGNMTNG